MPSPKPRAPRIKNPGLWVVALVLLASAMILSIPAFLAYAVSSLASDYLSILNEPAELDSQPEAEVKEEGR